MMFYTVGVRRRFLPVFKKYKVFRHDTETLAEGGRLILQLADGSQLGIPGIARRVVKVYPDYRAFEFRMQQQSPAQQPAPTAVEDFDAILAQQRAAGPR
jgi:hypothetical protein